MREDLLSDIFSSSQHLQHISKQHKIELHLFVLCLYPLRTMLVIDRVVVESVTDALFPFALFDTTFIHGENRRL